MKALSGGGSLYGGREQEDFRGDTGNPPVTGPKAKSWSCSWTSSSLRTKLYWDFIESLGPSPAEWSRTPAIKYSQKGG